MSLKRDLRKRVQPYITLAGTAFMGFGLALFLTGIVTYADINDGGTGGGQEILIAFVILALIQFFTGIFTTLYGMAIGKYVDKQDVSSEKTMINRQGLLFGYLGFVGLLGAVTFILNLADVIHLPGLA